jgi:hypothetical protein
MIDTERVQLELELDAAHSEFFGHAQTLRASLNNHPPETLLGKFALGTTKARAALHLSRGCLAFESYSKAAALAEQGLVLAGERAHILIEQLKELRDTANGKAA